MLKIRSPRSSDERLLFPPECVHSEKLEVKVSRKTNRRVKFYDFSATNCKRDAYKRIESCALKMGMY